MKSIDYKVEGGKLLRIDLDISDDVIKSIKINGDFFMHPEEKIKIIEEKLIGIKVDHIKDKINEIIKEENIEIIGFKPEDIEKAINKIN